MDTFFKNIMAKYYKKKSFLCLCIPIFSRYSWHIATTQNSQFQFALFQLILSVWPCTLVSQVLYNSPNNWPKEPREWGIVRLDLHFWMLFWLSKECHTETSLQLHTQHIHGASSMYANIHYPGLKDFKDKLLILKVKMLKTSGKKKLIPKEHQNHHLSPNYPWFWLIGNPHFECRKKILPNRGKGTYRVPNQPTWHLPWLVFCLLGLAFHSAEKKTWAWSSRVIFLFLPRVSPYVTHIGMHHLLWGPFGEKLPKILHLKNNSELLTLPIYPFGRPNMLWGAGKLDLAIRRHIWFRIDSKSKKIFEHSIISNINNQFGTNQTLTAFFPKHLKPFSKTLSKTTENS